MPGYRLDLERQNDQLVAGYSLRTAAVAQVSGFTITAVLTLAMAIGANAVVFSVMNGLILRPLNVPEAKSLYGIERAGDNDLGQSYPDYLDVRDRNRSFDGVAGYSIDQVAVDAGDKPSLVWGMEATGNYFDVLRIQPYLGRFFHASDEHGPNSAPYMVLSYAYWHSHFHDDRGVLGHTVQLNKHPFTIIGVAPPGFRGTLVFFSSEFFVPIVNQQQIEGWNGLNDRASPSVLGIMGHLKPGVTPAQATADLNLIGAYLGKTFPKDERQTKFSLVSPSLLGNKFGRPFQAFFAGLMLLAGLILLAACANLGSLFAARAADRSREVALRLALGSSRTTHSARAAHRSHAGFLGRGAVGLWAGVGFLRRLSTWQPFGNFPMHTPVTPDATVYGLALILSLISGLLFGAVPVRHVLRTNPYEVVKSGSTACGGPADYCPRRVTGYSNCDLCSAGYFLDGCCARAVSERCTAILVLNRREPFWSLPICTWQATPGDRLPPIQKRLLDAVAAIPGVESVGLTDALLLNDANGSDVYTDRTTDLAAFECGQRMPTCTTYLPNTFTPRAPRCCPADLSPGTTTKTRHALP